MKQTLSPTLAMNERVRAMVAEGKEVFRFGFGQSPFEVPGPVVEALKANAHQKDYLPVRGLWALRQSVVDWWKRTQGEAFATWTGDQVLVGPGSKELMFQLQMGYRGTLLLPNPSWVSYVPHAEMAGQKYRWMECHAEDGFRLNAETLAMHCDEVPGPKLLVLNSPNNPCGHAYDAEHLEPLVEVLEQHTDVLVLSDEIYSELHFAGEHVSIARYLPDRTCVATGLSKWCGAGGWRLGVMMVPPELTDLADRMASWASDTVSCASAPIQYAAVDAWKMEGEVGEYVRRTRATMAEVGGRVGAALADIPDIEMSSIDGGFYVYFRLPGSDPTWCERLLNDTGVALLHGSAFGRPADEISARLAFVDLDKVDEGMDRLVSWLKTSL